MLSKISLIIAILVMAGCATQAQRPPTNYNGSYKQAFQAVKAYVEKCLPGAAVRANLYTDVPEAEIIIDHLPAASMFFVGAIGTSSYESAHQDVNIHFLGKGNVTEISAKTDLSSRLVASALEDQKCPSRK